MYLDVRRCSQEHNHVRRTAAAGAQPQAGWPAAGGNGAESAHLSEHSSANLIGIMTSRSGGARAAIAVLHQPRAPTKEQRVTVASEKQGDDTALIRSCPLTTAAVTPEEDASSSSSSSSEVLVALIQWQGSTWVLQKQALEVLCCGLLPSAASLVVGPDDDGSGGSSSSSCVVVVDAPAWLLRGVRSAGVAGLSRVTVAKLVRLDAALRAARAALDAAGDAASRNDKKAFANLWLEYCHSLLPWASSGATPIPRRGPAMMRRRASAAADEEGDGGGGSGGGGDDSGDDDVGDDDGEDDSDDGEADSDG